jgi:4-hydroxy-tetrahydrodipicolinate reductase
MKTIALTILGASGKMGQRVLQLARSDPHFQIVNLHSECDVAIDFTFPEGTLQHIKAATAAKKPLVIGTTGHSAEQKQAIVEAAKIIPVLHSPNFSFGMALCLETAANLGKVLFGKCTIDIHEAHHVHKKDSPSGTALALAKALGGKAIVENGNGERNKEEILIHSVRSGETVGEHTMIFECEHERIEIKHTAHSRDAFAHGALIAAKFLVKQPPGLYNLKSLFDVNY